MKFSYSQISGTSRRILPFYVPPTLILKQATAAIAFKKSTGWKLGGRWIGSLNKLLKVAAGARLAGCFGYAPHPVLEVTGICNLKCKHCEVRGGEVDNHPRLAQLFRMIDSIATVPEFRMLVLSGGEPFTRKDIYEVIKYARDIGFEITIATNGTLISRETAEKLYHLDIGGVAISLDFIEPELHDNFRGVKDTWMKAMEGLKNSAKAGLYLQVNITLSKLNYHELEQLLLLSDKLNSHVVLLYQFQPFGRGREVESLALTPSEYLKVIKTIIKLQRQLETLIIPIGLPQYFAYLSNKAPTLSKMFTGCIAGRGMFYVKWYGDAWPCAFLQIKVGNVLEEPAIEIWKRNELLIKLRDRGNLKEPCRSCSYRESCGGCRSRAYLLCGDPLAADTGCPFVNKKN